MGTKRCTPSFSPVYMIVAGLVLLSGIVAVMAIASVANETSSPDAVQVTEADVTAASTSPLELPPILSDPLVPKDFVGEQELLDPTPTNVSGTGTSFEFEGVTVTTDQSVKASFMAYDDKSYASLIVESDPAAPAGAVSFTVENLKSSTTYYLYVDGMENAQTLESDANGTVSFSQDVSGPHSLYLQDSQSTIQISQAGCIAAGGTPTTSAKFGRPCCSLPAVTDQALNFAENGFGLCNTTITISPAFALPNVMTAVGKTGVFLDNVTTTVNKLSGVKHVRTDFTQMDVYNSRLETPSVYYQHTAIEAWRSDITMEASTITCKTRAPAINLQDSSRINVKDSQIYAGDTTGGLGIAANKSNVDLVGTNRIEGYYPIQSVSPYTEQVRGDVNISGTLDVAVSDNGLAFWLFNASLDNQGTVNVQAKDPTKLYTLFRMEAYANDDDGFNDVQVLNTGSLNVPATDLARYFYNVKPNNWGNMMEMPTEPNNENLPNNIRLTLDPGDDWMQNQNVRMQFEHLGTNERKAYLKTHGNNISKVRVASSFEVRLDNTNTSKMRFEALSGSTRLSLVDYYDERFTFDRAFEPGEALTMLRVQAGATELENIGPERTLYGNDYATGRYAMKAKIDDMRGCLGSCKKKFGLEFTGYIHPVNGPEIVSKMEVEGDIERITKAIDPETVEIGTDGRPDPNTGKEIMKGKSVAGSYFGMRDKGPGGQTGIGWNRDTNYVKARQDLRATHTDTGGVARGVGKQSAYDMQKMEVSHTPDWAVIRTARGSQPECVLSDGVTPCECGTSGCYPNQNYNPKQDVANLFFTDTTSGKGKLFTKVEMSVEGEKLYRSKAGSRKVVLERADAKVSQIDVIHARTSNEMHHVANNPSIGRMSLNSNNKRVSGEDWTNSLGEVRGTIVGNEGTEVINLEAVGQNYKQSVPGGSTYVPIARVDMDYGDRIALTDIEAYHRKDYKLELAVKPRISAAAAATSLKEVRIYEIEEEREVARGKYNVNDRARLQGVGYATKARPSQFSNVFAYRTDIEQTSPDAVASPDATVAAAQVRETEYEVESLEGKSGSFFLKPGDNVDVQFDMRPFYRPDNYEAGRYPEVANVGLTDVKVEIGGVVEMLPAGQARVFNHQADAQGRNMHNARAHVEIMEIYTGKPGGPKIEAVYPGHDAKIIYVPASCADNYANGKKYDIDLVLANCPKERYGHTNNQGDSHLPTLENVYLLIASIVESRESFLPAEQLTYAKVTLDKDTQVNFRIPFFPDDPRGPKKRVWHNTKYTGSELNVIEPAYVVWDGESELYPFVFESDSEWTVDVCIDPPAGYQVADGQDCVQTIVANEPKVVLFDVVEVGSVPTKTKVKMKLKDPKGKTQQHEGEIGIRLSEKLAKKKGVKIDKHGRPEGIGKDTHGQQKSSSAVGRFFRSLFGMD